MEEKYIHRRYFKLKTDGTKYTYEPFTSVADAKEKISFKSVWDTSSPTVSEVLDGDDTLVVTYEFDTKDKQNAFLKAVHGAWSDSSTPWAAADAEVVSEKMEFLSYDKSTVLDTVDPRSASGEEGSRSFD